MEKRTDNKKFLVTDGAQIGKLIVLGRVYDLMNHELFNQTPRSYIVHGNLWECQCECGKKIIVSEFSLSRGRNKSCGCMKLANNGLSWEENSKKVELKLRKQEINARIKRLTTELAHAKIAPIYIRDNKLINSLGDELRSAYAIKAHLTRLSKKPQQELTPEELEMKRKEWLKKNLNLVI